MASGESRGGKSGSPRLIRSAPWGSALDAIRTHLRSTLNCDACGEVTWRSGGLAALVTDLELARTCDMVGAAGVRICSRFRNGEGLRGVIRGSPVEEPSFRDLT